MRRQSTKPCAVCGTYVSRVVRTYCSRRCRWAAERRPVEARFWDKVVKDGPVILPDLGPCWPWNGRPNTRNGYGYISLGSKSDGRIGAHQLSWQIHFGPIPDGLWVLHKCDNPPCVRPEHLFLGTVQDNVDDMWAKGRGHRPARKVRPPKLTQKEAVLRGEQHHKTTLTEDVVRYIRAAVASGVRQAEICKELGLSRGSVSLIVLRQRWAHVT